VNFWPYSVNATYPRDWYSRKLKKSPTEVGPFDLQGSEYIFNSHQLEAEMPSPKTYSDPLPFVG